MVMLKLLAPLQGWCAPLGEVPDPVFADRLLGDGVAIDPTGNTLHAPCAGEVISVAPSKHAVTLRGDAGVELLMHVGIDTVALAGAGFEALVAAGARVRAGDVLLRFDLDLLARRARSLITPVVVTGGAQILRTSAGSLVNVGDELLELSLTAAAANTSARAAAGEESVRLVISHEHGIHARPAAAIAICARGLQGDLRIAAHGRSANARSAVAIMALGIRRGDEITLLASGADAAQALRTLKKAILGKEVTDDAPRPAARPVARGSGGQAGPVPGVIASRGLGTGVAVRLQASEIEVEEKGGGFALETEALERARSVVRFDLAGRAEAASGPAREVTLAHLTFLDDWDLVAAAQAAIATGVSAGFAWRKALRDSADALRSLNDPRMNERVDDLADLETQVLRALTGAAPSTPLELPERAVLIAGELKPSELIALDASRLAGIGLAGGGPTSHVALLAASLGVPALVALGPAVLDITDGTALIVDAERGYLTIAPDAGALAAAELTVAQRRQRQQAERNAAQADCHMADGTRIEVFANLASLTEARLARTNGAEGCGLLRTEFLFLERQSPPDEAEQFQQYQAIAQELAGRPLIIRTLDAGGDKPIAYLPLPAEDNPALGLRGVRTSLWRPQLLRTQLSAILRVAPAGQCRILLPMITDVAEISTVRGMIEELARELARAEPIEIGAMIETPASAVTAGAIAREVDFLSIGTNDLTQYTLAMDRGHAELAQRVDGLHPAVLALIAQATAAAEKHGTLVAVCGGLASDPSAVPVLLGLGVRELSVVPTLIPQLKSLIRTLSHQSCRQLAAEALAQSTAAQVRALVGAFIKEMS